MSLIRIVSVSMCLLVIFCNKTPKSVKSENDTLPVKTNLESIDESPAQPVKTELESISGGPALPVNIELESIIDSMKLHDTCYLSNSPVSIIDTNPLKAKSPVSNIFSDTLNISNLPEFSDSVVDSVLPDPLKKLSIIHNSGAGSEMIDEENAFVNKKPVQGFIYYLVSKHGQIIPDPLKFDSISIVSNYSDNPADAEYLPVWKIGFSSPVPCKFINSPDGSIIIIGSNQPLANTFIRHRIIDDSLQNLILKSIFTDISFQKYFSSIDFYFAGERNGKKRFFIVFNRKNYHVGTYMYAVDVENDMCSVLFHFAPFENSQYLGCFSLNKQPFADVFIVRIYEVVYALLERNGTWIEIQISDSGYDGP